MATFISLRAKYAVTVFASVVLTATLAIGLLTSLYQQSASAFIDTSHAFIEREIQLLYFNETVQIAESLGGFADDSVSVATFLQKLKKQTEALDVNVNVFNARGEQIFSNRRDMALSMIRQFQAATTMNLVLKGEGLTLAVSHTNEFIDFKAKELSRHISSIAELTFDSAIGSILGIFLVCVFIALFGSLFIARHLAEPIKKIADSTQQVGEPEYEEMPYVERHDEVGLLSRTIVGLHNRIRAQLSDLQHANAVAESANKAKSDFLANMSHEIRTPLTAIKGFSDMMRSSDISDPNLKEGLESISVSCEHLLRLINDVLDLSKVEAGKLDVTPNECSVHQLVGTIKQTFDSIVMQKTITFSVNADQSVPLVIVIDDLRLYQVLINLIGNALKFTSRGSVRVEFSFDHAGSNLIAIIQDTGIGISNHDVEKIFEDFTQATSTTAKHYGGTGIGLHLSKQLVELMGGSLSVKSELGVGSEFYINLPVEVVDRAVIQGSESQQDIVPVKMSLDKDSKILIAEDNQLNQRLFQRVFNRFGFSPTMVNDGKEAADAVKNGQFDLVFLDIRMPVMNGLEACKIIHRYAPSLPLYALTANVFKQEIDEYTAAGFSGILEKPLDFSKLKALLGQATVQVQQPDENVTTSSGMTDELSEADMQRYRKMFREKLTAMLPEIKQAIESDDAQIISDHAHHLSGTASMLGFEAVASGFKQLDTECSTNDSALLMSSYDKLLAVLASEKLLPDNFTGS